MKKLSLIIALVVPLLFSISIPSAYAQTGNDIVTFDVPLGIEVKNIKRLGLASSDLIVLDLEIKNVGNKPHLVHSTNLVLADSKSRIYEIVSSFELSNQDEIKNFWNVRCELFLYENIQAGITEKFDDLCFQVPPERNLEYFLIVAESNYEWCSSSNPYLKESCGVIPLGTISLTPKTEKSSSPSPSSSSEEGGCLIATATYGTELAPEVQNLREIRNQMYETELGGDLMRAVNDFYYSFSPTVADWERENPAFKETVKLVITPAMTSFTILDHNSIDTEESLIGYVVGLVLLNVGMYFVAPALIIHRIKKLV